MDKDQLKIANDKLIEKRAKNKAPDSPRRPDQVKAQKWQGESERLLPLPLSEGQTWAANIDPFEPVSLGSNLAKWEAFNWDRAPKLRTAKRIIVDWYNGLPGSGALVIAGDVGCGKTHLSDAIADLYGRWRIAYYGEVELIKHIQATYDQKGQTEGSVIRSIFRQELLIIDDLGTYRTGNTDWLDNIYNQIFNDYLTVKAKPILITTNLPMFGDNGMAERIGVRSFSRLCDALGKLKQGRYIDIFGIDDMRIEGYLG
jgi:DNA replication protein DnaC